MNDQDIFEHKGRRFRVHIERDEHHEPPWESNDGHGPVRASSAANKRPGERVLYKDRHTHWYYDWQAATKLARKDGWNVAPFDVPNRIERAVQADFDYLRRWCNNDWWYVGVCVELLNSEGMPITDKYEAALWGIESDIDDYIEQVALELASEVQEPPQTDAQRYAKLRAHMHYIGGLRWCFDAPLDVATLDEAVDALAINPEETP
jgi:hypothetical protein